MILSNTIARLVTQRRGLLYGAIGAIVAVAALVLVARFKLDTEVLNLLPGRFESVAGLKLFNSEFSRNAASMPRCFVR